MLPRVLPALLLCGCTFTLSEAQLLREHRAPVPPLAAAVTQEPVELPVAGATLRGAVFKVAGAARTIVFFHGNGGSVVELGGGLAWLAATLKADVVCLDFRGHGFSDGHPTFATLGADAVSVADWARGRWPERPLFLAGYSLGTSLAIHAAVARPVAGLALVAPPSSIQEMARSLKEAGPWYLAFWSARAEPALLELPQPVDEVSVVTAPLLIVHGTEDEQVPPWMGERLLARSPAKAKTFCPAPGEDHGSVFMSGPMRECFARFFAPEPTASAK